MVHHSGFIDLLEIIDTKFSKVVRLLCSDKLHDKEIGEITLRYLCKSAFSDKDEDDSYTFVRMVISTILSRNNSFETSALRSFSLIFIKNDDISGIGEKNIRKLLSMFEVHGLCIQDPHPLK